MLIQSQIWKRSKKDASVDSGWCEKIPNSDGEIDEPASPGNNMFHHLSVTEYQERKAKGWQPFLIDVKGLDAEYQQKAAIIIYRLAGAS